MENFWKDILEFAKNVDSIYSILTLILLILFVIFVIIWKNDKQVILNMLKGGKFKKEIYDMLIEQEKLMKDSYEQNKKQHEEIFDKIERLQAENKIDFFVKNHAQKMYRLFDEKIENSTTYIDKALKDIIEQGVDANIGFYESMLIVGLNNDIVDSNYITERLKSIFRNLRNSNTYRYLNIRDIKSFKNYTEEKIIKPAINQLLLDFMAKRQNLENGDLMLEFSKINIKISKDIINKTIRNYEEHKK